MNIKDLNRYKDFDNYVSDFIEYFCDMNSQMHSTEFTQIIAHSCGTMLEGFEENKGFESLYDSLMGIEE